MLKNRIYLIYTGLFVVFIFLNFFSTQHFYNHIASDSNSKVKEIDYTINQYAKLCLKNNSELDCREKINNFLQYYPKQYYGFQVNEIKTNTVNVLFDNRRYKDDERSKTIEFKTEIKALNQPIAIVINSVPNIYKALFNQLTFSLFDGKEFSWYVIKGRIFNGFLFFIIFIALFVSIFKSYKLQKNISRYNKNNAQLENIIQKEKNEKIKFKAKINKLENQIISESSLEDSLQEEFLEIEKEYSARKLLLEERIASLQFENKNIFKQIPSKNRIIELEKTEKEYKNILTLWANTDTKHKRKIEKRIDPQLPFVMSQAFVTFERVIGQKINERALKEKKLDTLRKKANYYYKDAIPNQISNIINARNKFFHSGILPNNKTIESVFYFLKENNVSRFVNYRYPKPFLELRDVYAKKEGEAIYKKLNRGIKILETSKELNQYLLSYGNMHSAKMEFACEKLFKEVKIDKHKIQIIDYACGQGVASVVLLNNLEKLKFPIDKVNKITLIEPGHIALNRANYFLHNSSKTTTINKKLDEIIIEDLKTDSKAVKFHLFSNILDMGDEEFNIKDIANKIIKSQKGNNYFICVSPREYSKLNKFMKFFSNYKLIDSSNGISSFHDGEDWQIGYNIFQVEL